MNTAKLTPDARRILRRRFRRRDLWIRLTLLSLWLLLGLTAAATQSAPAVPQDEGRSGALLTIRQAAPSDCQHRLA